MIVSGAWRYAPQRTATGFDDIWQIAPPCAVADGAGERKRRDILRRGASAAPLYLSLHSGWH
jgi:hypothetical protein